MEASKYSGEGIREANLSNSASDPRLETGWWSSLTGGQAEKRADVAQSDYLNEWNADQAILDRQFSSAEAQKQRDYETMMSNSAYQRAYQDMKKAGLNPALMYAKGGMSASTPGGASASGSRASGQLPHKTQSATGQLAGIIGSIAFASAKAVSVANTSRTVNTAMKGYKLGSGKTALNNFYNQVGI